MARFNKTQAATHGGAPIRTAKASTGFTGNHAPGFEREAKSELFLLAVSNFVGADTFYEKADRRDERFVHLIYAVADLDPDWLKRFLPWLRRESNMRTAALVGAVEAARAFVDRKIPGGRQLIDAVLQRADEPGEMLGYVKAQGYKLSKPIKRGIADAVQRLYSEFSLLKYDTASHAFRFGDVLELCHPDAKAPWQSQLFKFAIDRRHNRGSEDQAQHLPMVMANNDLRDNLAAGVSSVLLDPDKLKAAGFTWEDALSLGGSKLDKKLLWEAMIPNMGYMALLRNLRNFDESGVSNQAAAAVMKTLSDSDAVVKSRQLPMRFLSAFNAVKNVRWHFPLEQAMQWSLQNVPEFKGRTLILIDTSGSMNSVFSKDGTLKYWDAAALFGLVVAQRCEDPTVVSYSGSSMEFKVPRGASLLTLLQEFRRTHFFGGGTATQHAVAQRFKGHDRIILLTDEQANQHYTDHVFSSIPRHTFAATFNLVGYKMAHASGAANRPTIGGLNDNAFKLLPMLEDRAAGKWPF